MQLSVIEHWFLQPGGRIVKNSVVAKASACGAFLMLLAALRPALARAVVVPTPVPPYSLSTFAISKNGYSKPDSITFSRTNVFVGYGNGGMPDGSGGAMSTIVKYKMDGTVLKTFTVAGHNDGLRLNRETGDLWALQNEDGNSTLIIIEPGSGKMKTFTLGTGPHGGGYDDLVFDGGSVFITASAPTLTTNTAPAVVSLKLKGNKVKLTGVINGNASATDVTTGSPVTLNLQDPDSMIRDPFGELVLTSQADGELVIVQHPARKCQKVFVVPLTSTAGGQTPMNTTADDTVFADAAQGELLVADKSGDKVYAITTPYFAPGAAYSAVVATATPGGATVAAFVGRTDLTTGFVTPIVTGLLNPGGIAFIPAEHDADLGPVRGVEECP
jgi:hypothetical protein